LPSPTQGLNGVTSIIYISGKRCSSPSNHFKFFTLHDKQFGLELNPIVSDFVNEAWHWKYSSAIDYSGGKGLIEIDYL